MYMEMYIWEESKAGRERCPTPEFQPQLLGIEPLRSPPSPGRWESYSYLEEFFERIKQNAACETPAGWFCCYNNQRASLAPAPQSSQSREWSW